MSPPVVSVVMPAYNAQRYLGEAVQSVLGQTLTEFELIVVDDGSTDDTEKILEGQARQDARIRVVSEGHRGVASARNRGAEIARGEFVAVMDADDVALPDRLEKQVQYLRRHPECVAVGGQMRVISPHATVLRETSNPLDHEAIDRLLLQGFGGLAHPTAMIRRTALDRVAGYRSEFDYADDLDLILRLSEVGRLANLPETVIKYRLHIDSICHTKAELQRQRTLEFVREAHRRRGLEPPQDVAGSQLKVRSRLEWHYRFGRMAIRDGRFWSAWSHVLRSLCLAPTKPHSWKMLLSAMLRREI